MIETATIRKLGYRYGFLLAFHSNYGSTLYHFRNKARYWWKIVIFLSLHIPAFDAAVWNIVIYRLVREDKNGVATRW